MKLTKNKIELFFLSISLRLVKIILFGIAVLFIMYGVALLFMGLVVPIYDLIVLGEPTHLYVNYEK